MRSPRDKFGKCERIDVIHKLFNHEIVRDAQIGGGKSQVRERKIKTIHAKCDLVSQFIEISLLEAWAIANDESTFAFVNVFQRIKTFYTFTPPRMQIRLRHLRDTSNRIIGIAGKCPKRLRNDLFEGLFHDFENLFRAQPCRCTPIYNQSLTGHK